MDLLRLSEPPSWGRRAVLTALGAAALAPSRSASAAGTARGRDTVSVMMFGSSWERVFKPLLPLFRERAGVEIVPVLESSGMEGLARLQASRLDIDVDVWFTGETVASRAAMDPALFAPIDATRIPALARCSTVGWTDRFIPYWSFPVGIVYRTDLVPGGRIESWAQFFSETFADEIAVAAPTLYPGCSILVVTMLRGGTLPDIAPGMAFLRTVRDRVAVFNSSDTIARRALARGDIWAMMGSPSALKELHDAGVPVAMVCPVPTPLVVEGMMLLEGPRKDAAMRFIDLALSAEVQARMTAVYNLLPVNEDVAVPALLAPIAARRRQFVHADAGMVSRNLETWTDRFNDAIND